VSKPAPAVRAADSQPGGRDAGPRTEAGPRPRTRAASEPTVGNELAVDDEPTVGNELAVDDELAGGHPTAGIDDTVHQRHRLGILTITAEAQRADFGQLRAALGLTAGNLSRHLTVLEEAGLVQVEKGYEGRRPRTWVRITSQGRKALAAELATLTELVRRHSASPPD
jgi:DNA-binding transcriptional ArsR family regulator